MILRTMNNNEAPLVDAGGQLASYARLSFQLVDRCGRVVRNAVDALSLETVATGIVSVTADVDGLFSVSLWPTSRGANSYYYRVRGCTSIGREVIDFVAPFPDGAGSLPWSEFMALAGLWQDGHEVGAATGQIILVETQSGTSFELGVAIDPDTQLPTTTFTELA